MENIKRLTAFVDCARNSVLTVKSFKKFIDYISAFGYNSLEIYTEDVFEVDGEEMFGYLRGKYSKDELKELVAYGESKGIELIPCIETLAHMEHLFRWKEYKEICDIDNILLVDNDRTYTLIENMFKTLRECFNSKYVDIAFDEAHHVGLGKFLDLHGYEDHFSILGRHLKRVCDLAEKYGFKPFVDSDMFYSMKSGGNYYCYDTPDIIKDVAHLMPENAIVTYWDYFTSTEHCKTFIKSHRHFNRPIRFLGSINNWGAFSPRMPSGIFWLERSLKACIEEGITDVGIAGFGDDGGENSYFANLPTYLIAAEFYNGNFDMDSIKAKFKSIVGIDFDDFMKLCYPTFFEHEDRNFHSEKIYLFNDPFLGIFDDVVYKAENQMENRFPTYIKELDEAEKRAGEYAYLFRFASDLCDVLRIKYNLGVKTRTAYKSGDKEKIKELLPLYDETVKRTEKAYASFHTLWRKERKGNGLEIQAMRFGGLIQRLKDCKSVLEDYINGNIDIIEELEEDIKSINEDQMTSAKYGYISTVNALSHYNIPV